MSTLHARRPAITEDLLWPARDEHGCNPYRWLAGLLPETGQVLDLCCGSAPLADLVGVQRYLGVDTSSAELVVAAARRPSATTVRADVLDAELDGAPFAAVALSMALMLLPLEAVLVRVRDWLAPTGVLAATVPLRDPRLAGTPYNRLLTALGWAGEPFREPLDGVAARARRQNFAVVADEQRFFPVPIADVPDRELLLGSFYLPERHGQHILAARELLLAEVAEGRTSLHYPIRRLCLRPLAGQ